jgi:hypothetical protein
MQEYLNEDILEDPINLQINSNIIINESRLNIENFNINNIINDNYLHNFNEVIIKNKNLFKVFINNIEITEDNLNKLNDCYSELTNCPNLNDNDYMILSDIMQAINFIYKEGRIEFDYFLDGVTYTSSRSCFHLRGSYSDLKSEQEKLINNISIARNFVENQINNGNLLCIIQKTQSSMDEIIRNAGQMLDLILINNRSSSVESNKIINMPKLSI